jgi:hypothetical protein
MTRNRAAVVSILLPIAFAAAAPAAEPKAKPPVARLDLGPVATYQGLDDLLLSLQAMMVADDKRSPVRCEADATPIGAVEKSGPLRENLTCADPAIKTDQRQICRDGLDQVRKACDDACATFEKLDANEMPTGRDCARDKGSRTTATPGCVQTTLGTQPPRTTATAKCTASIACICDP